MAKDLLFEIGTEEIPARFMKSAIEQIQELATEGFKEKRLSYEVVHVYGTPRRLALLVEGLGEKQANIEEEVKGPSEKAAFDNEGKPTKAVLGFARGQGVSIEDLNIKETPQGKYMFAMKKSVGQDTVGVLPEILMNIVHKIHFPKPMRWGDLEMKFARPIRWLVALFGDQVLNIEIAGKKAGRESRSHRFLGSGLVVLDKPSDYLPKLKENYCIVDQKERKNLIWQQIVETARVNGGQVRTDEELLEEVTYLLEYPTALCGSFEEKYLRLPPEVLITPMREHQRYFPVFKEDGSLLPKFITVRNGVSEHIEIVTAGNEKVLRARLADAEFFYREDLKKKLGDHVERLGNIVFHEKLGSLLSKVERVQKLVQFIGEELNYTAAEIADAKRGAYLAKADLVSNVVYEFPELQGIMGEYYARNSGESEAVSVAIREHYLPRFAGDEIPQSKAGIAVAIADKVDSIVGFFGMNILPTGSQDPYALRRQALGVVQIVLQHQLDLSLRKLAIKAYNLLREQANFNNNEDQTWKDIQKFFQQRMDNVLTESGVRYDVINAVLAGKIDYLGRIKEKALAISDFRQSEKFRQLIAGFIRVANLGKNATHNQVREELFLDPAESLLYKAFKEVRGEADQYLKIKDYQKALAALAELSGTIDDFFTAVMVMVEEDKVKENRLALLRQIADYVKGIADLSQIVE